MMSVMCIYHPVLAKVHELKIEKENLEEYFRQLVFIKGILEYILIEYSDKERQSFHIELKDPKYNYLCPHYIASSLNSLLNDSPSIRNSFSKTEIEKYIERLKQEISSTNERINTIIRDIKIFPSEFPTIQKGENK